MTIHEKQFNIHELHTGRQANNVSRGAIADVVSVWFKDISDDAQIRQAIEALTDSEQSDQAMKFLGITLTPIA